MKGGVDISPGFLYKYHSTYPIEAYNSPDQFIIGNIRDRTVDLREAISKGFVESKTQNNQIRQGDIIYVLGFVDIQGETNKAIHCQVFPSNDDKQSQYYEAYLDDSHAEYFSMWKWDESDGSVNINLKEYLEENNPELLGLVEHIVSPLSRYKLF